MNSDKIVVTSNYLNTGGKEMLQQPITLKAMTDFAFEIFDNNEEKAALILKAILDSRSPRLRDISQVMSGSPGANYKLIQRFLAQAEPGRALLRLYMEEAPGRPN